MAALTASILHHSLAKLPSCACCLASFNKSPGWSLDKRIWARSQKISEVSHVLPVVERSTWAIFRELGDAGHGKGSEGVG